MIRPLEMGHDFLAEILDKDAVAVDATMGNGHDTLFLAKSAKQVYAFDIQAEALVKTRARLEAAGLTNVQLILAGHEWVDQYVSEPIRVAIFNLGYLPAADKSVITKADTTLLALGKLLERLVEGGRIAIMVYHGHEGGAVERDAVLDFVKALPQQEFTVALYQTINQINHPPFLIMIEKLKKKKGNELRLSHLMDKQYLQEKLAGMRNKYIDSTAGEGSLASKLDQAHMSKKMLRIKKKLLSLEMERCQKKIEHRDLSKIDQKISQQKTLFEECCNKQR